MSNATDVAETANTFLFVPGNRPERFDKAASSEADMVIIDLEDAVAPELKNAARDSAVAWLNQHPSTRVAVRINAIGTPWYADDVAALDSPDRVLVVPKATSQSVPGESSVIALVETAAGMVDAPQIARATGVIRLAFGSFDLAAELGVDPLDQVALSYSRSSLVIASAAAQLPPPIDGVFGDISNEAGLIEETERARRMGFGAKLCIHPAQVLPVATALRPSEPDIAKAETIVAAAAAAPSGGVITVDGQMVDKPVIDRAERLLAAKTLSIAEQEQP